MPRPSPEERVGPLRTRETDRAPSPPSSPPHTSPSPQTLLHVLKRESVNLQKKKAPSA